MEWEKFQVQLPRIGSFHAIDRLTIHPVSGVFSVLGRKYVGEEIGR